jgi:DNA-binding response OmpR family regulator
VADVDVLIVEDAPECSTLVSAVLRQAGHRVRAVSSIGEAMELLSAFDPDVVILDLTLPDGDGLDLCSTIRRVSSAYIVVLSGRDDEVDKLLGFRLGADDYVTKPFSPRELGARVDAMLRRPRSAPTDQVERCVGDLVIGVSAREVLVAGERVELTRIEFDLLDTFAANPKLVFTRGQLMERVWRPDWDADEHVVDVHVANLRKKIDRPGQPSRVRTVRGVGYGLAI